MAAIVVKENTELDVGDLYSYVSNNLPNYAAPLFIRLDLSFITDRLDTFWRFVSLLRLSAL